MKGKKCRNLMGRAPACLTRVLLAALLAFSVIGCGSGGSTATAVSASGVRYDTGEAPVEETSVAMPGGNASLYLYTPEDAAVKEAAQEEEMESGSSSYGPETESSSPLHGRKLIRTVTMNVETDQFDALLTSITDRIAALGGYIEQSDISGQRTNHQNEPIPRNAYLLARVPSQKLEAFTASVEEGGSVTNRSENTQDVTLQYSDVESRKKSLTIEQERIWELLEKADSLDAIIALEERLSEIRYQLESLESQLRLYDNQVDYSTVTLYINEVTDFTPTAPETVSQRIGTGFSDSLKSVSRFCTNLFIGLISTSPIWAPVLVILLLVRLLLRRRRWKKEFLKKASETAPEDENNE